MSEEKKELNEEQLAKVAGGAGNITPKYHAGDIYGMKIVDDGHTIKAYEYGVIKTVAYDYKGPHGYIITEERKSSVDHDRLHVTISVIDYKRTIRIEDFDAKAKIFDKLPEPGSYDPDSEYFF